MGYGDSGNWDGTVPSASPPTEFKIDFQTQFQVNGGFETRTCVFSVFTGDSQDDVAAAMAQAWNKQNPGGPVATHDNSNPNRRHQVVFGGLVRDMGVKAYLDSGDPPPEYTHVQFGMITEVLNGFGVFNA